MLKTILNFISGALVAAAISTAFAVTGTPPSTGPGLQDGSWLNALSGGLNMTFQSGISAAGTTQATATAITPGVRLVELDTVASSTGIALPQCLAGWVLNVYNNGAQTVTVYPAVANNPITAAQDTINNGTSTTQATHTSKQYACAKNGVISAQ